MSLKKKIFFYYEVIISIPRLIIESYDKTKKLFKNDDFSFLTPSGWKLTLGENFVIASSNSFSSKSSFSIYWYNYVFDHYDAVQNFMNTIKKQHKQLGVLDYVIMGEIEYDEFLGIPSLFVEMKYTSEKFHIDAISKTYIIHTDQRTYAIVKQQDQKISQKEIDEFNEIENSLEFHEKFNPWNIDLYLN